MSAFPDAAPGGAGPGGGPRVALLGFMLETNGFAPVATAAEFREKLWLEGNALLADARSAVSRDPGGIKGFVEAMDAAGPWRPVPLALTSAGASGPADQAFFEDFVRQTEAGLRAAMPLDGVYAELHGAAGATGDDDPDGTLLAAVRRAVGPGVPVVGTLDLHANVSRRMVAEADLLVAFLTNPHVDMQARGREAGAAMRELLRGTRTAKAFVALPILPPSVALLSDRGPYGAAIARGQAMLREPGGERLLNVSVLGNFSLGDSPKNGMSVVVTARGDQDAADRAARSLAAGLWEDRHALQARLTPIADAARRLRAACDDPALPSLLFADVADNPGGGARGNTTDVLRAFLDAGVTRAAFAIHYDPELAREAHGLGAGARFTAELNRAETHPDSRRLRAAAEVMALSDGRVVGRRGLLADRAIDLGPTARLRLEGRIDVVFVSVRHQCMDPAMVEHLGIDLRALRGLVVKSRGHFRAGFDEVFPDARIVEVDGPGLVTPVLSRVPWRRVRRPIWPLDPDLRWSPPADVAVR